MHFTALFETQTYAGTERCSGVIGWLALYDSQGVYMSGPKNTDSGVKTYCLFELYLDCVELPLTPLPLDLGYAYQISQVRSFQTAAYSQHTNCICSLQTRAHAVTILLVSACAVIEPRCWAFF